jgi:hypothetical protein
MWKELLEGMRGKRVWYLAVVSSPRMDIAQAVQAGDAEAFAECTVRYIIGVYH